MCAIWEFNTGYLGSWNPDACLTDVQTGGIECSCKGVGVVGVIGTTPPVSCNYLRIYIGVFLIRSDIISVINERLTMHFNLSNPTIFSYPNECRIGKFPLYLRIFLYTVSLTLNLPLLGFASLLLPSGRSSCLLSVRIQLCCHIRIYYSLLSYTCIFIPQAIQEAPSIFQASCAAVPAASRDSKLHWNIHCAIR